MYVFLFLYNKLKNRQLTQKCKPCILHITTTFIAFTFMEQQRTSTKILIFYFIVLAIFFILH